MKQRDCHMMTHLTDGTLGTQTLYNPQIQIDKQESIFQIPSWLLKSKYVSGPSLMAMLTSVGLPLLADPDMAAVGPSNAIQRDTHELD